MNFLSSLLREQPFVGKLLDIPACENASQEASRTSWKGVRGEGSPRPLISEQAAQVRRSTPHSKRSTSKSKSRSKSKKSKSKSKSRRKAKERMLNRLSDADHIVQLRDLACQDQLPEDTASSGAHCSAVSSQRPNGNTDGAHFSFFGTSSSSSSSLSLPSPTTATPASLPSREEIGNRLYVAVESALAVLCVGEDRADVEPGKVTGMLLEADSAFLQSLLDDIDMGAREAGVLRRSVASCISVLEQAKPSSSSTPSSLLGVFETEVGPATRVQRDFLTHTREQGNVLIHAPRSLGKTCGLCAATLQRIMALAASDSDSAPSSSVSSLLSLAVSNARRNRTPTALIVVPSGNAVRYVLRLLSRLCISFPNLRIGGGGSKRQADDLLIMTVGGALRLPEDWLASLAVVAIDDLDELMTISAQDGLYDLFQKFPRSVDIVAVTCEYVEIMQKLSLQRVDIEPDTLFAQGTEQHPITHAYVACEEQYKLDSLLDLLDTFTRPLLVLCNTRRKVEWLAGKLGEQDLKPLALHGALSPKQRHAILTACSVASRKKTGLILIGSNPGVVSASQWRTVVRYDVPNSVQGYIKGCSCMARGHKTLVVSLAVSEDVRSLKEIETTYQLDVRELTQADIEAHSLKSAIH